MKHSWRPTLDAETGVSICATCGRVRYLHSSLIMDETCNPDAVTAWGVTIDMDRATAVKRWRRDHLMGYRQIAELASSWDVPDDQSLYFGVRQFGETVCLTAASLLGEIEHEWTTAVIRAKIKKAMGDG